MIPPEHAKVDVRVTDVYEVVRAIYGGNRPRPKAMEATDRLSIALGGVPNISGILRQWICGEEAEDD
jgi:hypothetical protein